MPKSVEDIIVPERRRSIRDIPIPEGRRKTKGVSTFSPLRDNYTPLSQVSSESSSSGAEPPLQPREIFSEPNNRGRSTKIGLWLAMSAAIIILIFATLSLFNTSTLTYTPKSLAVTFDNDVYTARKSGEGELIYSVVKLSKDIGLDAKATGEAEVSRKSSGTIVVYNDATTEPQRLIATTRFETPAGLVFRIPQAIVIPGKKTVNGVSQPGSVETIIYADEAGGKYNIGLSDFTLPGLKGTARFSTIYARSKTEMSGGFVGVEKVIESQEAARVNSQLETDLKDALFREAANQAPEGFVLLASLSSVTFENLPQTSSATSGNVTVNKRGNLYGIMFKNSDLATHMAQNKVGLNSAESVIITNLDSLNVAFSNTSQNSPLSVANEISFSVSGSAKLVWRTDEVALKTDLAGRHKRELSSILNNYPSILSATPVTRPFWKKSFPTNTSRITVKALPVE